MQFYACKHVLGSQPRMGAVKNAKTVWLGPWKNRPSGWSLRGHVGVSRNHASQCLPTLPGLCGSPQAEESKVTSLAGTSLDSNILWPFWMSQRQLEASHPKLDSLSFSLNLLFCVSIWMTNKESSMVQDAALVWILPEAFLSFLLSFHPSVLPLLWPM